MIVRLDEHRKNCVYRSYIERLGPLRIKYSTLNMFFAGIGLHIIGTHSMFVQLEGRTREEAFEIGQEIASAVTAMNPTPVTLKMEKVYHPCVLLTKKRYVGYSYETLSQEKPIFDAKGIETIRRDSCPAVAKTLEWSLRTLFETQDLSKVQ